MTTASASALFIAGNDQDEALAISQRAEPVGTAGGCLPDLDGAETGMG